MNEIKIGDKVRCNVPGSWCDGKTGIVQRLNVMSSDRIKGHQLKMPDCVTIIEPHCLKLVDK